MKTLNDMSEDERSLLLYVESVAVEYGGLVHSQRINEDDRDILKQWDEEGFISYSRLTFDSIQLLHDKNNTSLVRLSEEAWKLAHEERRARSARKMATRPISELITTKTKNSNFIEAESQPLNAES